MISGGGVYFNSYEPNCRPQNGESAPAIRLIARIPREHNYEHDFLFIFKLLSTNMSRASSQ